MTALIRLYVDIALAKRGPQDVPASGLLLALTIAGYFAINSLMGWVQAANGDLWLALLAIDIVFTLAWYTVLLAAVRRKERTVQTTTAVFGYRAVLAPLTICASWLLRRFGSVGAWQVPLAVFYIAVLVWIIAADSHILKAAIEWSMFQCVALAILENVTGTLLVVALIPLAR